MIDKDRALKLGGCGKVINVDAWCDPDAVPSTAGLCDSPTKHKEHLTAPEPVAPPAQDELRDILRVHHPIMRSETGPFSGCRCGQVRLGQDVIAHVVGELVGPLAGLVADAQLGRQLRHAITGTGSDRPTPDDDTALLARIPAGARVVAERDALRAELADHHCSTCECIHEECGYVVGTAGCVDFHGLAANAALGGDV